MNERPIESIHPVRPVETVREVELRRRPSSVQLRQWLSFSRRLANDRKKHQNDEDA